MSAHPSSRTGEVVVVTGGAGFIGSHVVDRLLEEGRRVIVVDDLSSGTTANLQPGAELEQFDLAAPEAVSRIARLRPSAVVHCAAQASVTESFRDPARDAAVNIVGGLNALRGALEGGGKRFVYVTTGGALYGHAASLPSTERDPIAPLSPYGLSKWIMERYLSILAGDGLSWVALRLGNVYGPRQRSDGEAGVVAIFADRMRRGEPVSIEGDGEQTRDFVFVADVRDAIVGALDHAGTDSLNVGTGRATSVNELFRQLSAIAGYRLEPTHAAARPGDVRHSVLDVRRAEAVLGWTPRTDLADGLRETYAALGATSA
jgi:UDP-glucose 4-epimerase